MDTSHSAVSLSLKRVKMSEQDTDQPVINVPARVKRSRKIQACESCRKHKTRCESPLSGPSTGRCHRCSVLSIPCSLESLGPSRSTSTRSSVSAIRSMHANPLQRPSGTSPRPALDDESDDALADVDGPNDLDMDRKNLASNLKSPHADTQGDPNDYAQAPMGIVWNSLRKQYTTDTTSNGESSVPQPVNMPNEVLSSEQTHLLMSMFDTHYLPWLNIPYFISAPNAPIHISNVLVLACCAVACRHLPPAEHQAILSRLQPLAEHAVLVRTFDPEAHASIEGTQALLVLATWAPAIVPGLSQVHDGGLIATGAVRMGLALKLDTCPKQVIQLRAQMKSSGALSEEAQITYEELMWKTRLWTSICNTEWNLTIGTSRKPVSVRDPTQYEVLDWRRFPAGGTISEYRDLRLGLHARSLDLAVQGLNVCMQSFDQFQKEMDQNMMDLEITNNLVQPLRWAFNVERIYVDYLHFQQYACRLLVLFHAVTRVRAWMGAHVTYGPWLHQLDQSGVIFARKWGLHLTSTAQTLLGLLFELKERYHDNANAASPVTPFATAPDGLYATVLFAATILVLSRHAAITQFGIKDPIMFHTTAQLLNRLRSALSTLALGPEHVPRRAAAVVQDLQRVWHGVISTYASEELPDIRTRLNQNFGKPIAESRDTLGAIINNTENGHDGPLSQYLANEAEGAAASMGHSLPPTAPIPPALTPPHPIPSFTRLNLSHVHQFPSEAQSQLTHVPDANAVPGSEFGLYNNFHSMGDIPQPQYGPQNPQVAPNGMFNPFSDMDMTDFFDPGFLELFGSGPLEGFPPNLQDFRPDMPGMMFS